MARDLLRTPFHMARLNLALATMAWQAAFVMPIRLGMMAVSFAAQRPDQAAEMTRMVTEKFAAAAKGTGAAASVALRGGDALAVAVAAIGPARRTLRANARRLARK
ncbi:hypothetical protein [Elioraea rosea]|uniref:hypothetical protein n=1 Tax=Elioraea rosea TaxID=2492390 RepID=UPI001186B573|nr:hypothetical protein [Elioraea rosea]